MGLQGRRIRLDRGALGLGSGRGVAQDLRISLERGRSAGAEEGREALQLEAPGGVLDERIDHELEGPAGLMDEERPDLGGPA